MKTYRANLIIDFDNETIAWKIPHNVLLKAAMPEALKYLAKRLADKDHKPSILNRDEDTFAAVYEIFEKKIASLQAKASKKSNP